MKIPEKLLSQWVEKLRDEKLSYRETFRITDLHLLRVRNVLTDQFHYSPLGLLCRTQIGKSKGKFIEVEFPEVESQFFFKGVTYTPYIDYEPQPKKPLPIISSIGPRHLYSHFGITFATPKESCDFAIRMNQRLTFEQVADFLTNKKEEKPTHNNPLLAF